MFLGTLASTLLFFYKTLCFPLLFNEKSHILRSFVRLWDAFSVYIVNNAMVAFANMSKKEPETPLLVGHLRLRSLWSTSTIYLVPTISALGVFTHRFRICLRA